MDQVIRLSITGRGADTDAPTVDDLFEQVRDYFVVMQEVERALAADGVNAIDWRVVSASTNSPVELGVAPFPREYAVNMDDRVDATVETAVRGFQILQERAEDPPFFTEKAIETAERFFSRVMNGRCRNARCRNPIPTPSSEWPASWAATGPAKRSSAPSHVLPPRRPGEPVAPLTERPVPKGSRRKATRPD